MLRAGEAFAKELVLVPVGQVDAHQAFALLQGQLDRLGDPRTVALAQLQAVDDDVDVVLFVLFQGEL